MNYGRTDRNRKHLRNRAFQLWCSTTARGDIPVLQTVSADDDIGDTALFQRLRRGDRQAVARLIEKLRQDDQGYWWQAGRYIWSDELTESLDEALGRRGDKVERAWGFDDAALIDWILPERLMELPTQTAERLLVKHWDHLRFSSGYVQAALYTATPRLIEMAAQTVSGCSEPSSLFKFVTRRFGIKVKGRAGIVRIAQLQALLPYFDHLDDHDLLELWETCNDHGWFEWRRQYLDSRLKLGDAGRYLLDDDQAMARLDEMFTEGHRFWAKHWADDFRKTGISVDHMMEVVQNWLSRQTDMGALTMAAAIMVHAGQRRHIGILSSHDIAATDQIEPILADTRFALKRRSLN